jgi:hypothetical protein
MPLTYVIRLLQRQRIRTFFEVTEKMDLSTANGIVNCRI